VRRAAWAAGAALLVLGCKGIFADSSRIIALDIVGPLSYAIQVNDTLQLRARALSAAGDTVNGAPVEWAVLDTGTVGIALDPATGLVVGQSPGRWRVQASVEAIRSDAIVIQVDSATVTPP
jgi:hypothetical protein